MIAINRFDTAIEFVNTSNGLRTKYALEIVDTNQRNESSIEVLLEILSEDLKCTIDELKQVEYFKNDYPNMG